MKCLNYISKYFFLIVLIICNYANSYGQEPQRLGKVTNAAITEISGIIPYSYQSGYFWVHNDSGDGPFVYLIDSLASLKLKVEIEGIHVVDVEDIARVKYNGDNYLVLGDLGNNLRDREVLSIYIIKEPQISKDQFNKVLKVKLEKEIRIMYADKRRDAEAFFVDPIDNHLYILSKRDFQSTVFCVPIIWDNNDIQVLKPLQTLNFTFTTAADISADGKYIVAKNLGNIFFWERKNGESVLQTLHQKPRKIPYTVEPQGEAICFDLNNRFLYTISERPLGLDSYLYKYDF